MYQSNPPRVLEAPLTMSGRPTRPRIWTPTHPTHQLADDDGGAVCCVDHVNRENLTVVCTEDDDDLVVCTKESNGKVWVWGCLGSGLLWGVYTFIKMMENLFWQVGKDSRRRPKAGMGLVMVMVKSKCGGVGFVYPPKREFPLNPSPLSAREPCVNCMLYLSVAIMLVRWSSHMWVQSFYPWYCGHTTTVDGGSSSQNGIHLTLLCNDHFVNFSIADLQHCR